MMALNTMHRSIEQTYQWPIRALAIALASVIPTARSTRVLLLAFLVSLPPGCDSGKSITVVDPPGCGMPAGTPPPLPSTRTQELCDGLDNDEDGYTDPHCPNVFCASDCDCTPGLLRDADCNVRQSQNTGRNGERFSGPGCNHAHSEGGNDTPDGCWGVLCPPNLHCLKGECLPYGTRGPCEPCDNDNMCAAFSRCISQKHGDYDSRVCMRDCGREACPDGYVCVKDVSEFDGFTSTNFICLWPGQRSCSD